MSKEDEDDRTRGIGRATERQRRSGHRRPAWPGNAGMTDVTESRILLFTGKGGVGKTTTAAATALRCADEGLRTMVLSTDPAHSLADAFDRPLGDLAVEIAPKLWG